MSVASSTQEASNLAGLILGWFSKEGPKANFFGAVRLSPPESLMNSSIWIVCPLSKTRDPKLRLIPLSPCQPTPGPEQRTARPSCSQKNDPPPNKNKHATPQVEIYRFFPEFVLPAAMSHVP